MIKKYLTKNAYLIAGITILVFAIGYRFGSGSGGRAVYAAGVNDAIEKAEFIRYQAQAQGQLRSPRDIAAEVRNQLLP